jgi:hypothetical protein
MKKIIIKDPVTKSEQSVSVKTGLVLYKNKHSIESIKFIDNLPFPDAISLFANALLYLMKTFNSLGVPKEVVFHQFYHALDKALEAFSPEFYSSDQIDKENKRIQETIDKITSSKPLKPEIKEKITSKEVIDPYNQS